MSVAPRRCDHWRVVVVVVVVVGVVVGVVGVSATVVLQTYSSGGVLATVLTWRPPSGGP